MANVSFCFQFHSIYLSIRPASPAFYLHFQFLVQFGAPFALEFWFVGRHGWLAVSHFVSSTAFTFSVLFFIIVSIGMCGAWLGKFAALRGFFEMGNFVFWLEKLAFLHF